MQLQLVDFIVGGIVVLKEGSKPVPKINVNIEFLQTTTTQTSFSAITDLAGNFKITGKIGKGLQYDVQITVQLDNYQTPKMKIVLGPQNNYQINNIKVELVKTETN